MKLLRYPTLGLLTALVTTSLAAAVPQRSVSAEPLLLRGDWSLVSEGTWLGALSAEPGPDRSLTWTVTPIDTAGGSTHLGEPRTVAPVVFNVEGTGAYGSALRLVDGRWALAGSFTGGGSRFLELRFVHDFTSPGGARPQGNEASEIVGNVQLADAAGGERTRALDLVRPALFEDGFRLYVVGSARRGEGLGGGWTWIGEARVEGRSLSAVPIGRGVDARVARQDGTTIVAVRDLREGQRMAEAAPVLLYASEDLQNWKALTPPPEAWQVSGYDLRVTEDGLWLFGASLRRGTEDEHYGELLRFDADERRWRVQGDPVALTAGESENVRLLAPPPGRPAPAFLCRDEAGRFDRRPL